MKNQTKNLVPIDEIGDTWHCLTNEERVFLRENTSYRIFKKNEIIYREGEIPEYMFCLISGKVKLYKEGYCGRHQIIRLIRPNESFAYRAYFSGHPYITAAAAIECTQTYAVPLKIVKQMAESNNRLAMNFIKLLADDLGIMDARIVSLTQKHVRGRLAETLVMLIDIYGINPVTSVLNSTLSREDLASFANMTSSNCIRTLVAFENETIIRLNGKHIVVLDEQKLRKISTLG